MTTPSTLDIIQGTKNFNEIVIADLGGLRFLVAKGTARLVRFYIYHPATGICDSIRKEECGSAKRNRLCQGSIRNAISNAESILGHPIVNATKISSHRGTTVYLTDDYNIRVTRKTISERAGCGLRKNTSVCSWYAIDRADPVGGKSFSGYGGIRDAVAKLSKLATE
jgi:hypothetical protein